MTARYDMLVIDLDGTLLNRQGHVSYENQRAIHDARDAGIEVVIATGRALVESRRALEAIGHDGLIVAAGGSLLCEAATGKTLHRHVMPHDLVADVTCALLDHGHKVLILKDAHTAGYDYLAVGPGELDPASKWWFGKISPEVRFAEHVAEDEHPHDTVRAGVVASSRELAPIAEDLRTQLGDRAFLQHWAAVTATEATGSTTHLLEVFNPQVNKWMMITAICQERGIEPAHVAAIGDGLNDVEIVGGAGLGIAMANADPRVVAVADQVTDDHDDHGVARAIERILEGQW
jgi:Cof subfamily protein (haloacid dehalogenase superfamily)